VLKRSSESQNHLLTQSGWTIYSHATPSTVQHAMHTNDLQVDLIEQMGPLPFNLEFFTECQDMRQLLAYLDAPPDTGHDATPAGVEGQEGPSRDSAGESGSGSGDAGRDSAATEQAGDRGGNREGLGDAEGGAEGEGASSEDGQVGRRRRRRNERFHKMTEEICDVVDSYGLVCFYPLNIQVWLFSFPEPLPRIIPRCKFGILVGEDTCGTVLLLVRAVATKG